MNKIYLVITTAFLFLLCFKALFVQVNRTAFSGGEVIATFRAKGGSEFKILALGKGRLRVAFTGIYEYDTADGRTANTGKADGTYKKISGGKPKF